MHNWRTVGGGWEAAAVAIMPNRLSRTCTFSLWGTAQIADAAVIKMGLATLSLAMVREIQNAT